MTKVAYKDPAMDRFAKSNLYFEKDPYIMYQDPTVLGFKLMFHYNQPDSGLLSVIPHPNTAMGYLQRIGATDRIYYLEKFVNTLIEINRRTPWYFQTISGLGEAWKRGWSLPDFSPKLKDRKLEIGCLESIDLRMTAVMDLYRKACFDWKNRREIVPWNLRTFSFSIYVYESSMINRVIGDSKKKADNQLLLGEDPDPRGETRTKDVNLINDKTNRVLFKFDQCEFISDDSSEMFDAVSNAGAQPVGQKMSITYRTVYEENLYNLYSDQFVSDDADYLLMQLDRAALDSPQILGVGGSVADDLPEQTFAQQMRNELRNRSRELQDEAQQQIEARANNLLNSQIGRAVLGNIYGFSPAAIENALKGGINGLINLAAQIGNNSLQNQSSAVPSGSNLSGEITPNQPGQASGNTNEGGVGGESDGDSQTSLINYQESNQIGNTSDNSNSQGNQPGQATGNMFD